MKSAGAFVMFLSGKRVGGGGERIRTGRGEKRSKKSWDEGERREIAERKENWMNLDGEIILMEYLKKGKGKIGSISREKGRIYPSPLPFLSFIRETERLN